MGKAMLAKLELTEASPWASRKIHLCERCRGSGFVEARECIDYHRGEYRSSYSGCEACLGTGRQVEITYEAYATSPFSGKQITLRATEVTACDAAIDLKVPRE